MYGNILLCPQIYVVQDNVEIYDEEQYDELQKRNYADVDGPAYRFCTEYSVRHKGDSFHSVLHSVLNPSTTA